MRNVNFLLKHALHPRKLQITGIKSRMFDNAIETSLDMHDK